MRRIGLIALLAAALAAGAAGAGRECRGRPVPRRSTRRGSCDDAVVGWMVGTNAVQATCDPAWRVALSPQYQTEDGLWHGGRRVFNHIYYPAINRYFAAGSTPDRRPRLLHPLLGQRRRDGGVRAALPVSVADPRRLLDRDPGRPGEVRRRLLRPRAGHLPFRIALTRRAVYDIPGMPSAFRR